MSPSPTDQIYAVPDLLVRLVGSDWTHPFYNEQSKFTKLWQFILLFLFMWTWAGIWTGETRPHDAVVFEDDNAQ